MLAAALTVWYGLFLRGIVQQDLLTSAWFHAKAMVYQFHPILSHLFGASRLFERLVSWSQFYKRNMLTHRIDYILYGVEHTTCHKHNQTLLQITKKVLGNEIYTLKASKSFVCTYASVCLCHIQWPPCKASLRTSRLTSPEQRRDKPRERR